MSEMSMVGFNVRLLVRSMRWVAPTLFLVIYLLVIGNSAPSLSTAVALFAPFLMWGTWLAIAAGNLDDDPHRDLLAAAVGSAGRLQAFRAVSMLVVAVPMVVACAAIVAASGGDGDHRRSTVLLVGIAIGAAGSCIGLGIGVWLHRPIMAQRGVSVLVALGLVIVVLLLPPIQALLKSVSTGTPFSALWLLLAAMVWVVAAVAGSCVVALSRAR